MTSHVRLVARACVAVAIASVCTVPSSVSSSVSPDVPDTSNDRVTAAPAGERPILHDPMPVRPRGVAAASLIRDANEAPVPSGGDVLALASRPGAARTIYLDFTGGVVPAGSIWSYSEAIPYPAYTADDDQSAAFSTAEQANIYRAWATVVEDFAPFDVNVTTANPGVEALHRANADDQQFGVHAIITQAGIAAHERICKNTCGGIAVVTGIDLTTVAPVWTFTPRWRDGAGIGTTTSHEIGHALGLMHDGNVDGTEYYTGSVSWGPIMGGVMDSASVSHWSIGDYAGANNHEDDVAMIGAWLPPLPDDQPAGSPPVPFTGQVSGVLNDRSDSDSFTFTADGKVTVSVTPNDISPNVDAVLSLFTADGQPVARIDTERTDFASNASRDHLAAVWRGWLDRPTPLVAVVDGTGSAQPGFDYSDYGSIGRYTVSVTSGPGAPKWEKARWNSKVRARRWWSGVLRVTRSQGDLTVERLGSRRGGLRVKVSEDGRGVRVFGRPHKVGLNKVRLVAIDSWGERTKYVAKMRVLPHDAARRTKNKAATDK